MSGIDLNDCRTSRMPNGADQNFGWVIKRAGTEGPLKLVVLNRDMFGIRTHFFRGRTGPCTLENCDACKHKQLSRWKGYLLAIDASDSQQCVLEFTPPAAIPLNEAFKKYGTMRGLQVYVSRSSNKTNAKVVLTVKGITVLGPQACPDYAVWPIISHIWGVASDCILCLDENTPKDLGDLGR